MYSNLRNRCLNFKLVIAFLCLFLLSYLPSFATTLVGKIEENKFNGPGVIGIEMLIIKDQYPVIRTVFSGSPAANSGLRPGDIILLIDGRPAAGESRSKIDYMIPDFVGTPIVFTIKRNNMIQDYYVKVVPLEEVPSMSIED